MDKYKILKEYFGHTDFRGGQTEIIDTLLSGQDVMCIMPTGAGKSMCYQIPALMFSGITVVVSPLISLMKDQVNMLTQSGVKAAYINSSLTASQYSQALSRMAMGEYKIVYVAPERLNLGAFYDICLRLEISMVAVDEAHCVSHWGQDFRPSYLKITDFISSLPTRPVVGAFTATATDKVKEDISSFLQLNSPYIITTGFDRPNLYFSVQTPKYKDDTLLSIMEKYKEQSGIIYCSTRKNVDKITQLLCVNGYSAARYHAGLSEQERHINQDDFVYDRISVMVATNAFGMGIDKSNVSYVIHYNMPKSMEAYYQEAGRAGRDGEKADCILLYSPLDVRTNLFLIDNSEENPEIDEQTRVEIREKDKERLKSMTLYCTTSDCLRAFILKYFGETSDDYCGNCSNCESGFEENDVTVEAQKILSCVVRIKQRFGVKMVCDILRGIKSEKILNRCLDTQTTFGILSDYSEQKLRKIINFLLRNNYLAQSSDKYPRLLIMKKSRKVLFDGEKITMKTIRKEIMHTENKKAISGNYDTQLYAKLKKLLSKLARAASVPTYAIFTDASLREMAEVKPTTEREFLNISGMGNAKLKKYGKIFTDEIKNYNKNSE